jgi:hypothetical protein
MWCEWRLELEKKKETKGRWLPMRAERRWSLRKIMQKKIHAAALLGSIFEGRAGRSRRNSGPEFFLVPTEYRANSTLETNLLKPIIQ